jgi:hypothetical protein
MKWHSEQSEQDKSERKRHWERRTWPYFGAEDDGYMQNAELLESLALEKLNPTEVGNWYERADILVNEMSLNRHRYSRISENSGTTYF